MIIRRSTTRMLGSCQSLLLLVATKGRRLPCLPHHTNKGGQQLLLQNIINNTTTRCGSSSALSSSSSDSSPPLNYEKIRQEVLNYWMLEEAKSPGGGTSTRARYCCFTYHDAQREYKNEKSSWHWLDRELSSNLAGETGAVHIYKGALAAMKIRPPSAEALEFCQSHMANEEAHLRAFRSILPPGKHTKLLPIWKLAGWMLGFVPTMVGGSRALYVTVEAVETFVEEHFQEQIVHLRGVEGSSSTNNSTRTQHSPSPELLRLLEFCCEDEVHHKEDAAKHLLEEGTNTKSVYETIWAKPWAKIVRKGSAIAAEVARRV